MKRISMFLILVVFALSLSACFGIDKKSETADLDAQESGYDGSDNSGIGDFVWYDANQNGIQDEEEEGISGEIVILYDEEGEQIGKTVTNENGWYNFSDVKSGIYYLEFELLAEYVFSPQDQEDDNTLDSDPDPFGKTTLFTYVEGNADFSWDAGMYKESDSSRVTPTPTPTSKPKRTPTPTPTTPSASPTPSETSPPCGCGCPGTTFEIVEYDGSSGWSDCGEASACHSIIGDELVPSGTTIGKSGDPCVMKVICSP